MKSVKIGSKSALTQMKILNSAIYCLSKYGERKTNFQTIADQCGVTQPLVVHYLKKQENIFPAVMDYVFDFTLVETLKALDRVPPGYNRLKAYIDVSLDFFEQQPDLGIVYVQFYARSAYDAEFKKLNTKIKSEAVDRIKIILEVGISDRIYRAVDIPATAKLIHNSLTGLIINTLTETSVFNKKEIRQNFIASLEEFLKIA